MRLGFALWHVKLISASGGKTVKSFPTWDSAIAQYYRWLDMDDVRNGRAKVEKPILQ